MRVCIAKRRRAWTWFVSFIVICYFSFLTLSLDECVWVSIYRWMLSDCCKRIQYLIATIHDYWIYTWQTISYLLSSFATFSFVKISKNISPKIIWKCVEMRRQRDTKVWKKFNVKNWREKLCDATCWLAHIKMVYHL